MSLQRKQHITCWGCGGYFACRCSLADFDECVNQLCCMLVNLGNAIGTTMISLLLQSSQIDRQRMTDRGMSSHAPAEYAKELGGAGQSGMQRQLIPAWKHIMQRPHMETASAACLYALLKSLDSDKAQLSFMHADPMENRMAGHGEVGHGSSQYSHRR